MTLSTYLLYIAAVIQLTVAPGPTMRMCFTHVVNHGMASEMTSVVLLPFKRRQAA